MPLPVPPQLVPPAISKYGVKNNLTFVSTPFVGTGSALQRLYLALAMRDCICRGETPLAGRGQYQLGGVAIGNALGNAASRSTDVLTHLVGQYAFYYEKDEQPKEIERDIVACVNELLPSRFRKVPNWSSYLTLFVAFAALLPPLMLMLVLLSCGAFDAGGVADARLVTGALAACVATLFALTPMKSLLVLRHLFLGGT